ncbi:hypothetical protein ACIBQ0_13100 [Nocardia nova]|uniref:hypothetical protein n=1 Tax=Nocardia nova TaxID=37330 RepID=UPI0037BA13EF
MSDQEVPGSRSAPKDTGAGAPKVVQLPRRPRRVAQDAAQPARKTWRSEGSRVNDPPPTRPVMRSELQRETGAWPVNPAAAWRGPAVGDSSPAADDACPGDQDASVVDLDELRRKRAGEAAPAAAIRRIAKPRRIGKGAADGSGEARSRENSQDSPSTEGYTGRHRK